MFNILIATGVITLIGLLLGLFLALADKTLTVKIDPRVEIVSKMLPGLNCGLCGNPGCIPMAESLLSGRQKHVSDCKPSRPEQRVKIRDYINATPDEKGNFIKVEV